jgi:hypothetical protein
MKAIEIRPGEDPELVEMPDSLEEFQRRCKGMISAIRLREDRDDAVCYGNDESKLVGMKENTLATLLVYGEIDHDTYERDKRDHRAVLEEHGIAVIDATDFAPEEVRAKEPYVAGPVLIVGVNPRTGNNRDVPEDLVERIVR